MNTGIRRGELCALRWSHIDLEAGVLTVKASIAQTGRKVWEKDTKTHQQRRIALDAETVMVLQDHLDRRLAAADTVNAPMTPDDFVFSSSLDARQPLRPDTLTQRYSRMAARLGIATHLSHPAPLLGNGTDRSRRRHPYGRRPPRSWRGRSHHCARLCSLAIRIRPARSNSSGRPNAEATGQRLTSLHLGGAWFEDSRPTSRAEF